MPTDSDRKSESTAMSSTVHREDFRLDNTPDKPVFELESEPLDLLAPFESAAFDQRELFIPPGNAEQPEETPQIEFEGMAKPVHAVVVQNINGDESARTMVQFQHAGTLLESLEAQQIYVPYQCRDGYCGSCRTRLVAGEVAYLQEPMAWINDDEILPCCCVPKTDLELELKG